MTNKNKELQKWDINIMSDIIVIDIVLQAHTNLFLNRKVNVSKSKQKQFRKKKREKKRNNYNNK